MPSHDDPNRPEWTGKRKTKNFARINAACKGLKTSGGKPPMECPKCGTSHKFAACPVCGCPRRRKGNIMYKQYYIGKGPEAKALLDTVRAKVSAFHNECDMLSEKFKAEGVAISGDKRTLNGLVFLHRLSSEELKERGLKLFHHGESDGQEEFYYSPRLNTNAGKALAAALNPVTVVDASAEIISALNIGKLVVAPTKHGGILCTALHRSQAGYSGDTLVVVIPYGNDTEDEKDSVVIPGWLRPCKESEALAVFGK